MKKAITIMSVLLAFQNIGFAQNTKLLDSLRHELSITKNDSSRAFLMLSISGKYTWNQTDSSIFYANKVLALARKINRPNLEVGAMSNITRSQITLGNYARALQINLKAIKIAENNAILMYRIGLFLQSGRIYNMSNDYSNALNSFSKAKAIADSTNAIFFIIMAQSLISETFLYMNQLDSALNYAQLAYDYAVKFNGNLTHPLYVLGQIYFEKGNNELALKYLHKALPLASGNAKFYFDRNHKIAQVYHQIEMSDSSIFYSNKALEISLESKTISEIIKANILLSEIYENSEPGKALQYSKSAFAYRDTLDNFRKNATLEAFFDFDEQERQFEIESTKAEYNERVQKLWIFSIAGALLSAIFVAFILFRNNKNKQKANTLLKEQKEEIQVTLEKLEASQSLLIQSEKMASLGELTAGIAHEIQNPLNFVNNFAEVSKELAEELNEEVLKTKIDTELISEIAGDLVTNQEKINHHGQRASGIVKGMLEHSRKSTGKKEMTDINVLADEYLRLAYHGLRAKDKSFNADFKMEFDESLPKINVVSQDIGRVLLNLINNAFYTVDKKAKLGNDGFKPEVKVTTEKVNDKVVIKVWDNGEGIPEKVRNKIFQPFFTTKPTGSGTGLGLSLAYDIITKGHGGELNVDSKEGEGSEFKIIMPIF